jgi:hypothetical protein
MHGFTSVIPFALLLAACVTAETTYTDLTHTGRGLNQLKIDGAICDMALEQSPARQPAAAGLSAGTTLMNVGSQMIAQSNFFDQCMLSRGWERE